MAEDKTFVRNFSAIIVGLIIFTFVIIFLANQLSKDPDAGDNPSQLALVEERIAPVGAVNTGDYEAPVEASAATPPSTADAMAGDVGNGAPAVADAGGAGIDGAEVYNGICAACHMAGVAGAPVPGGTMNERASKGLDALTASVINGLGVMPPRGGNPALTDEQIRASVQYMLDQ